MPRRLRWLIPAIRFATESRPSYINWDSDLELEEKRPEHADIYDALSPMGLIDPGSRRLSEPKLLELSDDIRAHLLEDASLGDGAEVVKRTLRELNARLDKLLFDILALGYQQTSLHPRPRIDTLTAERLQRLWMARFREKYFNIDQIRHQSLSKTGRLKDVTFNIAATDNWELWQAENCKALSGLEPNLQFKPGQYTIRQYGHKQNLQNRLHRIIVTLERVAGQPSMTNLAKVPRPSQMDDWVLFEKFEGEMIRQNHGEQSFLDWKMMKAQERMERRQWRRALEVGAALTTARRARYSYGMRDLGIKEKT
ncbi:hypothetical protein TASIC1_0003027200 [Trichoderma asperellum]|uniref:Uncharacterized protein n=1 Tax=Trichoderma asperellum TaxID=101201 RepID=A0A6V8QN07_TRIAP|nr:hypothetical protein TASIC1_0003027200 [Trichoderma asperellum]